MSDAGDFIDTALRYESTWERAEADRDRVGTDLEFYGASVGAVRGTVRDALRRHPSLAHDDVLALASELWSPPVFERRLSATVLLQSRLPMLLHTDLTRIEGFLRDARTTELADPLVADVVLPLVGSLVDRPRRQAEAVLTRWSAESNVWLRRMSERG